MANNIAAYYMDELMDWNHLITFFGQEMNEMTSKLSEVIQLNTIPDIADKVELEQAKINAVFEKFIRLQKQIAEQVKAFRTDGTLKSNEAIGNDTERWQHNFRNRMQEMEKEYVDIKYNCYNFLSDVLNKQSKK